MPYSYKILWYINLLLLFTLVKTQTIPVTVVYSTLQPSSSFLFLNSSSSYRSISFITNSTILLLSQTSLLRLIGCSLFFSNSCPPPLHNAGTLIVSDLHLPLCILSSLISSTKYSEVYLTGSCFSNIVCCESSFVNTGEVQRQIVSRCNFLNVTSQGLLHYSLSES